ncbi:MAG: 2,3-bisphosphoglycerate-independent phosphoglycerate mutase [Paracoccaceae bacterium]
MAQHSPNRAPVVLSILDGWGLSNRREGNAVALAHTPVFDRIRARFPSATLSASGADVGLPEGQMGNSEVGHTNIGAGRVVLMDLPKIDRALSDGRFAETPALLRFADRLRTTGNRAHLLGLASPGGVHSHQRHIAATARALVQRGVPVALHLFTDGRDVAPESADAQVAALLDEIGDLDAVRVATVMGRFYAMDRDKRWDRVAAAVRCIEGRAGYEAPDARTAIAAARARGETDEFIAPTRIVGPDGCVAVAEGDGLFCANFRADRVREILGALLDDGTEAASEIPRCEGVPRFGPALGMVSYSDTLDRVMEAMFPPEALANTLGEWVAAQGLAQFRLAETEKYPHVTFFLNGGREEPFAGEDRAMPSSPKVRTYDLAPEMAAEEVADRLVEAIRARYPLIVVNFANPDMVGHTGDLAATIRACETADRCLGRALAAVEDAGGALLLTADHGNAECMTDPAGGPHTAHTTNPVPVSLVDFRAGAARRLAHGRLADLAPTVLALMGLAQPAEMTGRSLLEDGP